MSNIYLIFAPLLYFVALLIPVVFPGPAASLLLISYAKKKQLSIIHLVLLFIADGLCLFLIIVTRGLGSHDVACFTIPIAVFVSWRILSSSKALLQIAAEDSEIRRRIDVGMGLILFFQIIILVIVVGSNSE